ncbi:MAG: cupin domain-containing protein [Terracidiphilus sp.]
MNRREFSAFLPLLAAAGALAPAEAQSAHKPLEALVSGDYPEGPPSGPSKTGRTGHHLVLGMLPDNIRLEAHVTTLAPGAPPEPIGHHKHTEMWLVREGELALMTDGVWRTVKAGDMGICVAGDLHSVANASKTEPTSYFVIAVGPPE